MATPTVPSLKRLMATIDSVVAALDLQTFLNAVSNALNLAIPPTSGTVATTTAVQTLIENFALPKSSVVIVESIVTARTTGSVDPAVGFYGKIRAKYLVNHLGSATAMDGNQPFHEPDEVGTDAAFAATMTPTGLGCQILVTGKDATNLTWTSKTTVKAI